MIRKKQTFEVHLNKNLDQRCRLIFGLEYRKDPHLRTITYHITGSAFLPLHQDGLIEILFDKIVEIILAANVENQGSAKYSFLLRTKKDFEKRIFFQILFSREKKKILFSKSFLTKKEKDSFFEIFFRSLEKRFLNSFLSKTKKDFEKR